MSRASNTQANESDEFRRFRELTRLILQVPKSEVDKKLKARRKRSRNGKQKNRSDSGERPVIYGVRCVYTLGESTLLMP